MLSAPAVLAEADGLRFELQKWRIGRQQGLAWRVSFPVDAPLRVSASDHVVGFDALLPSAGGAWAAINGGFYEADRAMGLVVSDGVERAPLTPTGGSGVLEQSEAGTRIVHRDAWVPGAPNALQSIDRLVDGRRSLVKVRPDAPLAARSAVAMGADRIWLVVTASRESVAPSPSGVRLVGTSGRGMTLHDFAAYLVESTAAETALNLDGAVSSQLVVQAGTYRFEVRGERGTINAVVVGERDPSSEPAGGP